MDSLPFYQLLYLIFIAHYPDQVVRFEHRIVIRRHQRIPVTFDRNDQAVVPPSYVRLHDTLSEERKTVIDNKRIDRNLFRLPDRTIGTLLRPPYPADKYDRNHRGYRFYDRHG